MPYIRRVPTLCFYFYTVFIHEEERGNNKTKSWWYDWLREKEPPKRMG